MLRKVFFSMASFFGFFEFCAIAYEPKVIFVTFDGFRNEEFFNGAQWELMNKHWGGVEDLSSLKRDFWHADSEKRRKLLLPFLWQLMNQGGQVYGNSNFGSQALVSNPFKFSYPGYNEMITGRVDHSINSNELGPNPNQNVFEWLNKKSEFQNKLAVFGAWFKFSDIYHRQRSKIFIRSGFEKAFLKPKNSEQGLLNSLVEKSVPVWPDEMPDVLVGEIAIEYLKAHRPKLMHIAFGETDQWAHSGRYDLYLRSARAIDALVGKLWRSLQELPEYRNQTTLILTTDHGRGTEKWNWKHHGLSVKGSEKIWILLHGPKIMHRGENVPGVIYLSQVAATISKLLGQNYQEADPRVAKAIDF